MKQAVKQMLREIEKDVLYTRSLTGKKKFSDKVMTAISKVPRDAFVPEHLKYLAFNNHPLPIGHGQTISQPYIVALMSELLDIKPDHVILEIGTGSGYQTAVLSLLCRQVYSMELIAALSQSAQKRLAKLHYNNIETLIGNGYAGCPEHAPYDGIIVTAAATHIPESLVSQLKPGGKLVIPVGLSSMQQQLMLLEKDLNMQTQVSSILAVSFVPLIDRPVEDKNHV